MMHFRKSWLKWRTIVLDDTSLSHGAKAMALFLHTYMNDQNDMAWPSIETICLRFSLSNKTAIKHLSELVNNGYLNKKKRFGTSCQYSVDYPSSVISPLLENVHHSSVDSTLTVVENLHTNKQENKQENKQPLGENVVSTHGNGQVPIKQIIDKWNLFAEQQSLPQVVKITTALKGQIRQRWKDIPDLQKWDNFFSAIECSDFLSGRAPPGYNRTKPFRSTLLWITKETNFDKIAAGEYT